MESKASDAGRAADLMAKLAAGRQQQPVTQQETVTIPIGLVQLIHSYIQSSTGSVAQAMTIMAQLQQAISDAGRGPDRP